MPPRVCFPYDPDRLGGHVFSSFLLIESLIARGVDVVVAIHGEGRVRAEAQQRGLPIVDAPRLSPRSETLARGRYRAEHLLAASKLRAWIARERVSVVHANDIRMLRAWALPTRLAGARLVAHWRSAYVKSLTVDIALRWSAAIIAVSKYSRALLPAFAQAKCAVVYNPFEPSLDPETARAARARIRAAHGIPPSARVVGQFGSLTRSKRPHMLVDIVREVATAQDGAPVWGLLCGERAEPYDARLDSALRDAPDAAGRIVRPGHVSPVASYMAACDLIIQPSVREPLARTAIEAQSIGVPPIVSDDGGLAEVIRDDVDGLVLPAHNPAAWISAVRTLVNDAARRERLGAQGRAAAQALSVSRHVEAVETVYARAGLPMR